MEEFYHAPDMAAQLFFWLCFMLRLKNMLAELNLAHEALDTSGISGLKKKPNKQLPAKSHFSASIIQGLQIAPLKSMEILSFI